MSSWSAAEFAALFQAWREAIDTPLRERNKISHEVFRRFTVLVGGSTARSEGSVSFKQGSLKNMARLVMAFNDRDKWFAFRPEQKKIWFKMVNRKSYKFIDLDRPTFCTIEKLIQLQAASTNMRVTTASGNFTSDGTESCFVRVTLRRNPVGREWETFGSPPASPALPTVPSPRVAPPLLPLAPRQQAAAFLPPPAAAPRQRAPTPVAAAPRAHAPPKREFPFPVMRASDTRSIFTPGSAAPRPAQAAGVQSADKLQSGIFHDQLVRPSKRNDVIVFDDGDYDSGSSTESDSDAEMWEESESVATRLKLLESSTVAPVPAAAPRHTVGSSLPPVQNSMRSPVARQPHSLPKQKQKRSRPPLAPLFASASSSFKKQKIDPELMMVVNILEKQAQELKTLLAEVKEERESDMRQRAQSLELRNAREIESKQFVETMKLEGGIRQKEHEQRQLDQAERSRMLKEIQLLREEQKQIEQERNEEANARKLMLEQIAQEHEERRKDEEQRERERQERGALFKQVQQDREDRQRFQEQRKKVLKQMQTHQKAQARGNTFRVKLEEKSKKRESDATSNAKQAEQPKSRDAEAPSKSKHAEQPRERDFDNWSSARRVGQENKRPRRSVSREKDSALRATSKSAAPHETPHKSNFRHPKEDQLRPRHHQQQHRVGGGGRPFDPFDDKTGRMKTHR